MKIKQLMLAPVAFGMIAPLLRLQQILTWQQSINTQLENRFPASLNCLMFVLRIGHTRHSAILLRNMVALQVIPTELLVAVSQ